MKLQAKGAAVDLRGPDLDQLEQLLVDAGLGGDRAELADGGESVGRQALEIGVLAPGM